MLSPETMSHVITASDNCVSLTCEGHFSLHEFTPAWREIQVYLFATGWTHVLVNISALQTDPGTGEIFDLAKLLSRDFPSSGRIALVVRWEQSTFGKLLEVLVRSVGIYLTVFISEQQAKAWVDNYSSEGPAKISSCTAGQIYVKLK
jgi:hypothetical protein